MSEQLADAAFRLAIARHEQGSRDELRKRGVVPTPVALARYALRRVDRLLRSELAIEDGLASERIVVIDPAVGTGVWLAALLELTRSAEPRARTLIGLDLDRDALHASEHLLSAEAERQGVRLHLDEVNTLERARVLADDDTRVAVIVGNPPWAARSFARGALSDAWLSEFRRDAQGEPLAERRLGVLSDDYVRFFRWALEQARASYHGALVCFATNGSFLDGPVHRGMRASLVRTFDRLELLDLGGNALLSSARATDENVFGVRVGAALTWALRRAGEGERRAQVDYARITGARDDKLARLERDATELAGVLHEPHAPWFRFRPQASARAEADAFSLAEAFVVQREGVQTNRDALCTASSHAELEAQLWAFVRGEHSLAPARHFDAERVRASLERALEHQRLPVAPLAYRPLDERVFVALAPLCHRPRPELLRAVARSDLCLLSVRKERGAAPYNLFAVSRCVADACFLSVRSSCRTRVFPSHDQAGRDNLAPAFSDQLARRLGRAVESRELIAYALGVLGSPGFRAAHDEQLKLDYPRLPWPCDAAHFARAVEAGELFVAALCGPAPHAEFALHAPSEALLECARLELHADTLTCGGERVISGFDPAAWQAAVGQHPLARSALRGTLTLARVVEVLARAAAWTRAEQRAEAAFAAFTAR